MTSRVVVLAVMLLTGTLAAQQTPPQDTTLAARLERAERLLRILQQQINELAAAPRVEPRSKSHVELSGLVLVNGFFNNGKVNNSDVPQVADRPDTTGAPVSHLGGTVRQTQFALTAEVPQFAGGSFTGELDMDFYGGQMNTVGGRTWPLLRVRRVRAEVDWPHAWVMFGQEAPPISEANPSSLAQVGLAGFDRSGNLWAWIPQVRLGAELGTVMKVGLEGSVLAPEAWDFQGVGLFNTQPDRAELSRRPFLEGRLRLRWDRTDTEGEISVGGHYGWLVSTPDTLATSKALAASARFTLTRYLEVRGEAFSGQALSTLGGGGIGSSLGVGSVPVRTRGGWGQINLRPHPAVEVGGGFGLDDPNDADLNPATAWLRNASWEGHVQWRPAPLVLGAEFRRIETTYGPALGQVSINHINVAAGFAF